MSDSVQSVTCHLIAKRIHASGIFYGKGAYIRASIIGACTEVTVVQKAFSVTCDMSYRQDDKLRRQSEPSECCHCFRSDEMYIVVFNQLQSFLPLNCNHKMGCCID